MFKVIVGLADKREVEVTFYHKNPAVDDILPGSFFGTSCQIYRDGKCVGHGSSFLHPLDHKSYSKETGRKIALARALQNYGFNKMKRTQVWKAYFAAQNEARGLALTQGMIAL